MSRDVSNHFVSEHGKYEVTVNFFAGIHVFPTKGSGRKSDLRVARQTVKVSVPDTPELRAASEAAAAAVVRVYEIKSRSPKAWRKLIDERVPAELRPWVHDLVFFDYSGRGRYSRAEWLAHLDPIRGTVRGDVDVDELHAALKKIGYMNPDARFEDNSMNRLKRVVAKIIKKHGLSMGVGGKLFARGPQKEDRNEENA